MDEKSQCLRYKGRRQEDVDKVWTIYAHNVIQEHKKRSYEEVQRNKKTTCMHYIDADMNVYTITQIYKFRLSLWEKSFSAS